MRHLSVCRNHGGLAPSSRAAAERREKEEETRKFLEESGFWNPDAAEPITDAVAEFARQGGILKYQQEFLGKQINIATDCPCCGRKEWDTTTLRAMQFVVTELNKLLNNIMKYDIADRRTQIEEAQVVLLFEALKAGLAVAGITESTNSVLTANAVNAARQRALELVEQGGPAWK